MAGQAGQLGITNTVTSSVQDDGLDQVVPRHGLS